MHKVANRNVRDFGLEITHAAVSRRPPISLYTIAARTPMYTYAAKVWGLSIVQGPISVAPCATLPLRFATVSSRCADGCACSELTLRFPSFMFLAEDKASQPAPERPHSDHEARASLRKIRQRFRRTSSAKSSASSTKSGGASAQSPAGQRRLSGSAASEGAMWATAGTDPHTQLPIRTAECIDATTRTGLPWTRCKVLS
jgi:hypothetical protein